MTLLIAMLQGNPSIEYSKWAMRSVDRVRRETNVCSIYQYISISHNISFDLVSYNPHLSQWCSLFAVFLACLSKKDDFKILHACFTALPGKAPEHSEESAGWRSSNRGRNMLGFNAGPFKLFIVVSRGEAACKFPSMVLQRNAGARNRHVSASSDFFQHIQHLRGPTGAFNALTLLCERAV